MVGKRRTGKIRRIRPARLTVTCQSCDVTWKGKPGDSCWNCGSIETTEAPPAQIKVVS